MKAFIVASYCNNPLSNMYFPGAFQKICQVRQILENNGFSTSVFNTGPQPLDGYEINTTTLGDTLNTFRKLLNLLFFKLFDSGSAKPAIIWIYNTRLPEFIVAIRLKVWSPKAKLVLQLEDLPFARKENSGWHGLLEFILLCLLIPWAELVTCVSSTVKASIPKCLMLFNAKICLLPPMLDSEFVDAVRSRSFEPFSRDKIRIFYAGGYEYEKGVGDLIEAFGFLPANYRLHLAGPITARYRYKIKGVSRIFVHGPVSNQILQKLYINSDIVVNPHRAIQNIKFVFPFKAIEQLASGALPLVSIAIPCDSISIPIECRFDGLEELRDCLVNARSIWSKNRRQVLTTSNALRKKFSLSNQSLIIGKKLASL